MCGEGNIQEVIQQKTILTRVSQPASRQQQQPTAGARAKLVWASACQKCLRASHPLAKWEESAEWCEKNWEREGDREEGRRENSKRCL